MGLILLFGGAPAPPAEAAYAPAVFHHIFEISYNDPVDDPVWEDESDAVLAPLRISRGRSTEDEETQRGSAVIILKDPVGEFDPTNPASSHYPNFRPMRRVRVGVSVENGSESFRMRGSMMRGGDVLRAAPDIITLFSGFIESLQQAWIENDALSTVTIQAADGFKVLSLAKYDEDNVPSELSGARVTRVLDAIGWPDNDRLIDAGQIVMAGAPNYDVDVDEDAVSHLRKAAATEGGLLFVSKEGRLVFYDSVHELPLDEDDVWGDISGEKRYHNIIREPSTDSKIRNIVELNDPIGAITSGTDPQSVSRHYPREYTIASDIDAVANSAEVEHGRLISFLVRYRESVPRFVEMTPRVSISTEQARDIFSRELGDRLVARRRPPIGRLIEQESRIEGITIDALNVAQWIVTWNLSSDVVNLLTVNQTSLETDSAGWTAETNCSIASVGTVSGILGARHLQMIATGAGDMKARTSPDTQVPVTVDKRYEAVAYFRPGSAAPVRSVRAEISWRNSGGSLVSDSVGASVTEEARFDWTPVSVADEAPAGAAYATVRLVVASAGASEVHEADFITLVGPRTESQIFEGTFGYGTFGEGTFGGLD